MTEKAYKTTMTDNELCNLIAQYASFYDKKFRQIWKLRSEREEIYGELAVRAVKARYDYYALKRKTSNIRTYIISAMRKRMEDHRRYLYVRQVKWPMTRITEC